MASHPTQPLFPDLPPLVALHTTEGKYIYLNHAAFALAGIETADLMGRRWQDFASLEAVDGERMAVERSLASGQTVQLSRVQRRWASRSLTLDVTVTPTRTQLGTTIVLREARIRLCDPRGEEPGAGYFTSGQPPSFMGLNASSAGSVAFKV